MVQRNWSKQKIGKNGNALALLVGEMADGQVIYFHKTFIDVPLMEIYHLVQGAVPSRCRWLKFAHYCEAFWGKRGFVSAFFFGVEGLLKKA